MIAKSTHRKHFFSTWLLPVLTLFTLFSTAQVISQQKDIRTVSRILHIPDRGKKENLSSNVTPSSVSTDSLTDRNSSTQPNSSSPKSSNQVAKQKKREKSSLLKKIQLQFLSLAQLVKDNSLAAVGLTLSAYFLNSLSVSPSSSSIQANVSSKPISSAVVDPLPVISLAPAPSPVSPRVSVGAPLPSSSLAPSFSALPARKPYGDRFWHDTDVNEIYARIFKQSEIKERELADIMSDVAIEAALDPDRKLVAAIKECDQAIRNIEGYKSRCLDHTHHPDPDGEGVASDLAQCMVSVDRALAQGADPNTIVDCGGVDANERDVQVGMGYYEDGYKLTYDLNLRSKFPAWIFAIRIGCPYPIIKKLIDGGARINAMTDFNGNALGALYDYHGYYYKAKDDRERTRRYGDTRNALSILALLVRNDIIDSGVKSSDYTGSFLDKQYFKQLEIHKKARVLLVKQVCRQRKVDPAIEGLLRQFLNVPTERAQLRSKKPDSFSPGVGDGKEDGE